MRFHSQNLNEDRNQNVIGSMFWHGRAWLYGFKDRHRELFHVEWLFGKHARNFALTTSFGYGETDAGICFHICIPFIFSFYFILSSAFRCKEVKTGIAIHDGAFWIYPLPYAMETRSKDPWWRHAHAWYFPWTLDWWSTDILEHKANLPFLACAIWSETKKSRRPAFEGYEFRREAEKRVSEVYDYTYVLKNGTVQKRKATVYVDRMEWRARWWPLIPRNQVRTCINISFDQEVGEKTGSWKGGCTGCGYEMLLSETPLETLRRMERERKF